MSLFVGDHTIVPQVLSAKSAKGLQRKMLKLQSDTKTEYRFITMYYDTGKGEHVTWYYAKQDEKELIKEFVDDLKK